MSIETVAGTQISISAGKPASFDQAGYAALSFTKVAYITDGGSHGRTWNVATLNPIDTRGTIKRKTTFNDGQKTLQLAIDREDQGQALLRSALNSDDDFAFKVEYLDGGADYFQAQVTSFSKSTAGADGWATATVTLEVTSSKSGVGIVEVPATTTP